MLGWKAASHDIYTWMSQNKLKLNADKTEVLVLGTPKQRAKIYVPSMSVNGEIVKILNIPIGNLGSVFDSIINMAAQLSKAVKSANYHLRKIRRIKKYYMYIYMYNMTMKQSFKCSCNSIIILQSPSNAVTKLQMCYPWRHSLLVNRKKIYWKPLDLSLKCVHYTA